MSGPGAKGASGPVTPQPLGKEGSMPGGRPPKGPDLVDRLDGSEDAKHRLKIVLETLQGKRSVAEAMEILGVSESRFHVIREKALAAAISGLEPAQRGRPPVQGETPPDGASEVEALRREIEQLKEALAREKARADVAEILSMPASDGPEKKTGPDREDRRKKRKAERSARKKGRRNRSG